MKIVLIGAGNLATNLGVALRSCGHQVPQVYSRTIASATLLARKIGAEAVARLQDIDGTADLYVLALTDKAAETLAPEICSRNRQAIFVHTSGSLPMGIFRGFAERYGVIYPMQTFSKERIVSFSEIPCFIEAVDEKTLSVIETLCGQLSGSVKRADSETRRHLHLAAVFACNFSNHCFEIASRLLERHGFDFRVMYPLIDETVAKVHGMSPADAQTGPAVRFDRNIIGRHLRLLEDEPELKAIYELMSEDIHKTKMEHDKL